MKTFMDILEQKNKHLNQFKTLSENQYRKMQTGNFSHIKSFYHRRQMILNSLEQINHSLKTCKTSPLNRENKLRLKQLFERTKNLISSILHTDLLIHSLLDKEKTTHSDRRMAG